MRRTSLLAVGLAVFLVAAPSFATPEPEGEHDPIADAVRRRGTLKTYHRSMGITTWISLASTTAIGTMRFVNSVGFGEALCDPGNSPLFGRSFGCGTGMLTWHLISASFTTLSYAVTRILAALMPDPNDAAADNPRLRIHRALSWVHLAGMIAMPILGFATATTDDRKTHDALGTAHLITGYVTLATVSTAASLMAF